MKAFVLSLCAALLLCGSAFAYPTYFGPSGLANVPGPAAMGTGQYNIFYNLISASADLNLYGGNIGLGEKTPIELGATIVKPEGGSSKTVLNAKVGLTVGKEEPIDVAVGVIDVSDELDRAIYLVAGKVLNAKSAGKGGVPAVYGIVGLATSDAGLDGLLVGLTSTLPTGLNVHLEYDTEDVNLGVNYPLSEALNLRADLVSDETGFGISYTLPRKY